jgi:hypothetical protein
MSRLDIAEKRKPQDGRIKLKITERKSIDFRVSTMPTLWGEKIVMRILDSSSAMLGIDVLGYEEDQTQSYSSSFSLNDICVIVITSNNDGDYKSIDNFNDFIDLSDESAPTINFLPIFLLNAYLAINIIHCEYFIKLFVFDGS